MNSADVADRAVSSARVGAAAWAALPSGQVASLLAEVADRLLGIADRLIARSLQAKGFPRGGQAEAEEWLQFAMTFRSLRLHERTCRAVEASRPLGGRVGTGRDGVTVVSVFPGRLRERLLYPRIRGEVWVDQPPGAPSETVSAPQHERVHHEGQVAVLLGAGNAFVVPLVDMLEELVGHRRALVFKPSPINEYLAPLIVDAFAPMVRRGILHVVPASAGAQLLRHPAVDAVRLTGSFRTYQAIRAELLAAGRGEVELTSELGGVSPVLIVPGRWSRRDVHRQARRLATMLTDNAGFHCLTPRLLIQHRESALREALLDELRMVLSRVPRLQAYYPGAAERHAAFVAEHPGAWQLGSGEGPDTLPWTVIPNVDPARHEDMCFRTESFCGLLAETALSAPSPAQFLDAAVNFANTVVAGNLCASLFVRDLRDPTMSAAVHRAVARLQYGTVTVNVFPAVAYYLQSAPWGAYPADPDSPMSSGTGRTMNPLRLRGVRKSVVRGPFWPDEQTILVTSPVARLVARRLALL